MAIVLDSYLERSDIQNEQSNGFKTGLDLYFSFLLTKIYVLNKRFFVENLRTELFLSLKECQQKEIISFLLLDEAIKDCSTLIKECKKSNLKFYKHLLGKFSHTYGKVQRKMCEMKLDFYMDKSLSFLQMNEPA